MMGGTAAARERANGADSAGVVSLPLLLSAIGFHFVGATTPVTTQTVLSALVFPPVARHVAVLLCQRCRMCPVVVVRGLKRVRLVVVDAAIF